MKEMLMHLSEAINLQTPEFFNCKFAVKNMAASTIYFFACSAALRR